MACLCGDLYCGSCGPAQGNHKCYECGEWEADHEEHEAEAFAEQAVGVLAFIKGLAAGITPIDYHIVRTKARDLLANLDEMLKASGCRHDDTRCQEAAQAAAEAEALQEQETERLLREYEKEHGHSNLQADERRDLRSDEYSHPDL